MMWTIKLIAMLAVVALSQGSTIIQKMCSADRQMTSIEPGSNLLLGGLFEIRNIGTNGSGCGRPLTDTMQTFEASRYAVNYLNSFNGGSGYISGVKFGMDAYDTCLSASHAINALQKLYPQSTSSNPFCTSSNRVIAGTIGPLSSWTTVPVALRAGQLPANVISPTATNPSLSNKVLYPTFLRTVPSYGAFAQVIAELLQKLQWQNVVVIYTGDAYGTSGYEQLLKIMYSRGLCVSQSLKLDILGNKDVYKAALSTLGSTSSPAGIIMSPNVLTKVILQALGELPAMSQIQWILGDLDITNDISSIKQALGTLVVVPRFPAVDDFRQYFTRLLSTPATNVGNPWFKDWFEAAYGCSVAAGNCPTSPAFVQSPWAVPSMLAVFAYAEAIKSVCQNSGGMCPALMTTNPTAFNAALRNLDITLPASFPAGLSGRRIKFDANGDSEVKEFTIYNYVSQQGFQEIGRFESNVFTLDRQPIFYDGTRSNPLTSSITATCANLGCQNCLLPKRSVTYRYTAGDLVVASLGNAHEPGQAPYTCGAGRAGQLASLVAVEWAVAQFKTTSGQLRQVKLGSLVADVCPDPSVAEGFLMDLLGGSNTLVDTTGALIPYSNMQAFVDDISSEQAEIISPIISKYNIPEVVTSVTTDEVARGAVTPYFTRTVPSEKIYYSAISNLLLRLGWKYVQVATQEDGEYDEKAMAFNDVAAKYGICVVDTIEYFGDELADPYNRTLSRLLSNTEAQVVIVFGSLMDVRGLLTAIGQRGVVGQLQLISGTDEWGTNPAYTQGIESFAAGIVSVDLELSGNYPSFATYLQGLTLAQIMGNPFLRELFEVTNQCVLDPSSQSYYARTCSSSDNLQKVYLGRTPYVIQSVNTVLSKLSKVINDSCNSFDSLCPEFRSVVDVGRRLSAELANVPEQQNNGFGIINAEGNTDVTFRVYSNGWTQIATYVSNSETLTVSNLSPLGNYQSKSSVCSGVCMACQHIFALQTRIYNPGDWIIAGTFGVSNSGPERLQPYICGDLKTENGPQFTMAMLYALQKVNRGTAPVSVRGVTFGNLILDHCSNPGRAGLMASDVYADFLGYTDVDKNKVLAWITDTNESVNETATILDPLGVATISPSASSASLMQYPTFYRTIQGDAAAADALITIVRLLKYSYVQVVYSPTTYGREGLAVLTSAAQAEGICVTNSVEFSINASDIVRQLTQAQTNIVILFLSGTETENILTAMSSSQDALTSLLILMPQPYSEIVSRVGRGFKRPIISLQLQKFNISDYNLYINSAPVSNPYFTRYYMNVMKCDLPGYSIYNNPCTLPPPFVTLSSDYKEDNFVLSTIDAVYSVVDALHRTVVDYCGSGYTKPCGSFLAAPDRRQRFNRFLNNVNFVDDGKKIFRFLNREGDTAYDILQSSSSGSYMKVGRYSGQSLDFSDAAMAYYTNVMSTCNAPCLGCIMTGLNFSYTQGDIYLAGMFDVHDRSLSPFTCGKIQTLHGYLLLEAFHYALDQVNSKLGQFANILQGVRLGGVGLDSCRSDIRGGYLISNIHSGIVTLAKDAAIIYPSMIDTYIASYSSTASLYLAKILTDLKIPQISYGAGSDDLSDQRYFPYFYRTVPTDDDQVEAMLMLLDKLNIRYVQVLYEDNSNGLSAKDDFVQRAASYRICVAAQIPYPDLGVVSRETSNYVVARLLEKPSANTIVTFLGTDFINSVLLSLKTLPRASNKFRFIGSDSWADNQAAILNAESQATGSITLRLDADDIQDFENYISSKNLANTKDDPWFEEYFQEIFNCYTSKANIMGYPNPCPSYIVSLINSPRYQQDSDVVYVINAVYAAAYAVHDTLRQICGENYTAVCQAYRNSQSRHDTIRDKLATVSFTDPSGNNFMFVNRSGVANYRLNSFDSGLIGYTYQQIGTYNVATDNVTIYPSYISTWNSGCDRADACAECPAIRDQGTRYVIYEPDPAGPTATTVVAFFDVHKQGFDPYRCGEINIPGFQQLLTYFYTVERLLSTNNYRFIAIDTCSNSLRVDQDLYGLLEGTGLCNSKFDTSISLSLKNLGGVITLGDLNTLAASRVLELPGVPYISPNALSTSLDDMKHLVRTIAPISAMMKTLASFLRRVGWNYVDVVYSSSADGVEPYRKFTRYSDTSKICRASSLMVLADASDADIQNLLTRLNGDKGSRAVILIGGYNFVKSVLAAANSMSIANRYVWVLGIEWEMTADLLKDVVPFEVEVRIITLQRLNYVVGSFNSYFNGLTYNPNMKVPQDWFDEFYQKVFNCTIRSAVKPINIGQAACNITKSISSSNLLMEKYILNNMAATISMVSGLSATNAPINSLDNATTRAEILKNILNVNEQIDNNQRNLQLSMNAPTLKFDKENRWWDSEYVITYYQVKKFANGTFSMIKNAVLMQGDFSATVPWITDPKTAINVSSVCTADEAGGGCICTYDNTGTPQPLITPPFSPSEPRNYYPYHSNGDQQYDWPIWAITVAVITSAGILLAVVLFLILIIAYPIRGGTSALGFLAIIGIIGIYGINFAFFVHATDATCGARRFLMGVVYMIAIAPLLIKAIDNWRYGYYNEEKQRYSGISSAFVLFMAAIAIILIQCIIPIIWLILVHPTASEWAPYAFARHDNWWCDPPELYDTGLVQSFIFVMFIILVTAVFSALAFDSDRNNYESRWILFSCIITAGCFLVWMIVSTNAGPPFRDPAVAIANLVNATLLLIALPLRKSILLCRHLIYKNEKEDAEEVLNNGNGHHLYNGSYDNQGLDLYEYDNQFADTKPSEF